MKMTTLSCPIQSIQSFTKSLNKIESPTTPPHMTDEHLTFWRTAARTLTSLVLHTLKSCLPSPILRKPFRVISV